MEEQKQKKSIWNRLLAVVIAAVAALAAIAYFISWNNERTLDISLPYASNLVSDNGNTTAATFASDLVTARNFEDVEGFSLTDNSERALLFNIDSLEAVYTHGIYERAYPASLTKIMTAILALKYGNLSDQVVMEEADFALEEGSQNSDMRAGDSLTLKQLIEVLLVHSANDAANAIARHISGSQEAFVALMNEEAHSYGMLNTNFVNAHGLHDDSHYTCAYDVYLMLNKALKYSEFNEIIQMSSYTLTVTRDGGPISYNYFSTNEFLNGQANAPEGVRIWGGKTGTTPEAGACLALYAQSSDGIPYIAVIMNAPKKTVLYDDMRSLLNLMGQS